VAERAGVSHSLLIKVEAGVELPPVQFLAACATALGVDREALTEPYPDVSAEERALVTAERDAARDVLGLPPGQPVLRSQLAELADRLRQIGAWQRAGTTGLAVNALPSLITDLTAAVPTCTGDDRRAAEQLLAAAVAYQGLLRVLTAPGTIVATYRAPTSTYRPSAMYRRLDGPTWDPRGSIMLTWVVPLACVGIGALVGLGLAELYYTNNLVLQIVGGFLGILVFSAAKVMMANFATDDPGYAITWFGTIGGQAAIVMYALALAAGGIHPVLWLVAVGAWVVSSLLKSIFSLSDRRALLARWAYLLISMFTTLITLGRPWWAYLIASAVLLADVYLVGTHPQHGETGEGFDDNYPPGAPH
jgi:transcriptional regulator with XRE-family HTH domain